jgi:Abnormal spindle-like microcephaly-assoc'd, ASPM-SPD-2-Hydin
MRFPHAMSRLPVSWAVIAIVFISACPALARDPVTTKSALSNSKKERLIVTPLNLGFGRVAVGRRQIQTVTLTNWGDSNVRLMQVITQGRDFTLLGLDLPVTLARGESYTFSGVFAPRSRGAISGSVAFISDASSVSNPALSMELTGMGSDDDGQPIINPATMSFGTVQVGLSASQSGILSAGANQIILSSASSSSAEFTCSGLSFPVIIPAGGSQGFTVTFTPQASGTVSAALTFLDENGISLPVETLNGTGIVSQNHSVDLSWTASSSQNVVGYNIYRGNQSGGPYAKINSSLDSSTSYTDSSVTDGNTYYYVTTAVNSDNEESVYSNQAQATIP